MKQKNTTVHNFYLSVSDSLPDVNYHLELHGNRKSLNHTINRSTFTSMPKEKMITFKNLVFNFSFFFFFSWSAKF